MLLHRSKLRQQGALITNKETVGGPPIPSATLRAPLHEHTNFLSPLGINIYLCSQSHLKLAAASSFLHMCMHACVHDSSSSKERLEGGPTIRMCRASARTLHVGCCSQQARGWLGGPRLNGGPPRVGDPRRWGPLRVKGAPGYLFLNEDFLRTVVNK